MSPIYENEKSKKIEDNIAKAFALKYGITWKRHAKGLSTPDHFFYYPKGTVYSETKRRYVKYRQYEDYYIDMDKVNRLKAFAPKGTFILIGFDDVFGHISLRHEPHKTTINGRTDRNDKHDIDLVAHFSWDVFKVDGERKDLY
jgi:hypothetical protein